MGIRYWILFFAIFIPVFTFIMKHFLFPPGYGKEDNSSLNDNKEEYSQSKIWSFVAMRYYALILNRTFRIFVTDKYILGAKEGHVIGSPGGALGAPGPEWQNEKFYIDSGVDKKYASINLESNKFLKEDRANFRILRSDVEDVKYFPTKWGMGQVPYSGRLVITSSQGKKTELILLGKQDHETILKMLLQK